MPQMAEDPLAGGIAALEMGSWNEARGLLAVALETSPEGHVDRARAATALSETSWWLGDAKRALQTRRIAYETWRAMGDDSRATRAAIWMAGEYLEAFGNEAASRGWLKRAQTLAGNPPSPDVSGWLRLAGASLKTDWPLRTSEAKEALDDARSIGDTDLEARALARIGLGRVNAGELDDGLDLFHEAMAIASGGETSRATLGYVLCDMMLAVEAWGDLEPFSQWNEVVVHVASEDRHPPLISFCATCCAEVFASDGDWSGAEEQLREALEMLDQTDSHSRCIPPAAKLAELLIHQGRLEEADDVLARDHGEATLLPRAQLALEVGRPSAAVTLLDRAHRRRGGDSLLTVQIMALMVNAYLAAGDSTTAQEMARRLTEVAEATRNRKAAGRAGIARARVSMATGDTKTAVASLETALDDFSSTAPGAMDLAAAHLELARLRTENDQDTALIDARAAWKIFDAAGAGRKADEAAALARSLGDRSRVGAKNAGVLTKREREVLRLLAQGLSNARIADRLYISPKTAGNHVSNILTKLNLRSRAEAAAYIHGQPETRGHRWSSTPHR